MSKQETNKNQQTKGSDAPQASENENPLPEAVPASASAEGNGQDHAEKASPIKVEPAEEGTGMDVDGEGDGAGEDKVEVEAKPKLHTSGSQRKRFKWFISQGYEYEEASELAKDAPKYREMRAAAEGRSTEASERDVQLAQQRKALNRVAKRKYTQLREHGYSEEEAVALAPTLVNDPSLRQKHLKSDHQPKRPGVKIIVAMADYPRTVLTEEQAKLVKDAILKLVVDVNASNKATKPHFDGCNFIKGYLVFDCLDQPTITWLQHRSRELQLWDGCALRAMSEKVFRNSNMFSLHLSDSEQDSNEEIGNFLSKQNDGIDTSKWIFAERKLNEKTKTVDLMIKVDPVSVKALHELNFKLNYKFNQVTMKRIIVDLFDGESKPKKTTPPPPPSSNQGGGYTPQRRSYRGGYSGGGPQNRFGGRGGFNNYNRPASNMMDSMYDQLNRNLAFERQVRQNNFGGGGGGDDYIDSLLDQLNRSLYATGSNNAPSYYGRGGGRGGGGDRNFPAQRFF